MFIGSIRVIHSDSLGKLRGMYLRKELRGREGDTTYAKISPAKTHTYTL